jgi:putative phosphoesterase
MKIGLISDVHGDPLSLELAWSHLKVLGAERILCAGDLVGYGPFPDRAVAFVQANRIEAIRGNHDRWAINRGPGKRDDFGGGSTSLKTITTLSSWPTEREIILDGRKLIVFHGSPLSDMEYIRRSTHGAEVLDKILDDLSADILVVGHTHDPMCYRSPNGLVVNPGSAISLPVVRTSRTFALLEIETMAVTIHDVESGRVLDIPSWT